MAGAAQQFLSAAQLPDPNDTQDYGSDFDDEELQELNHEIDRIYGKQPTAGIVIEDNPITNDVEYVPTDVSVARIPVSSQPRSSQSRSQPAHIEEFEDDSQRAGYRGETTIAYPDRKSTPSYFQSKKRSCLTYTYSV